MISDKKVQSIFTRKHYINIVSCLIIWLSTVLFLLKLFEKPFSKIIYYSAIFLLVIVLIVKTEKYYRYILTKKLLFLAMLIMTLASILLYRSEYFGYQSIASFTIYWLAAIYLSQNVNIALIQLIVFILSPMLFSELLSMPGIFSLSMLVIVSILLFQRFLDVNKLNWEFFVVALFFGVTLTINIIVGFTYIIYLLHCFRNNFKNALVFILVTLIFYIIFLFLRDNEYLSISLSNIGYFQSMPNMVLIIMILFSVYPSWIVSDLHEVFFSSGIIYFFLSVILYLLNIVEFGWNDIGINLSFILFAIPFLALSIHDYKVDRFLGKNLD